MSELRSLIPTQPKRQQGVQQKDSATRLRSRVLGRLDAPAPAIAQTSEAAIVRQVVQQQLGRSGRFSVRKLTVSGGYALVSWNEGEVGGRA